MITDIEDYFLKGCGRCERFATPECSTRLWAEGLADLRRICLDMGLEETLKWGHPCYLHAGRNIAIVGAFLGDFRLSFFNAALMQNPDGVLEKQGPNTRQADTVRFTHVAQVASREQIIRSCLREAMSYAEEDRKPPRDNTEPVLPRELKEALNADPALAGAFQALTPGRQKSYVININGAKKSETRVARIKKFREKILAGKGATER